MCKTKQKGGTCHNHWSKRRARGAKPALGIFLEKSRVTAKDAADISMQHWIWPGCIVYLFVFTTCCLHVLRRAFEAEIRARTIEVTSSRPAELSCSVLPPNFASPRMRRRLVSQSSLGDCLVGNLVGSSTNANVSSFISSSHHRHTALPFSLPHHSPFLHLSPTPHCTQT